MDTNEIKQALHHLIDKVDDEIVLENIYDAFSKYSIANENNVDELTPQQKNRLEESLEQYYSGKTIAHETVKTELEKWRTK